MYSDDTSQRWLNGEFKLANLNTYDMRNGSQIRLTLGWRNPQEDAYDLTSINIVYNTKVSQIKYVCEDGYANGSVSTYEAYPRTGRNYKNAYNITIKEWTDNVKPDKNSIIYRSAESNECLIGDTSATERQD